MVPAPASALNSRVMRMTKEAKRGRQRVPDAASVELTDDTVASPADLRLRESNHRIKNHLQVLASALAMQSRQSGDEPARLALLEACSRVAAIGRLHQRLETAEFGDRVDVALFLRELCGDMRSILAPESADFRLDVDVEPASFSAERALPVGLLVSELVTNAVKHGSAGGLRNVRVSLRKEEARWHLTVADDGPGLEFGSFLTKPRLGSRLLFALADELGGSIEQDPTANGASISVSFPL